MAKSKLRGDSTARVDMHGINLSRANLEAARLDEANLTGANLRGANVRGARLNGANLRGAIIADVDLSLASLTAAKVSVGVAKLPPTFRPRFASTPCGWIRSAPKVGGRGSRGYRYRVPISPTSI